jgi:sulfite reductase (NADPH) flavoprotein alpha-component
MSIPLLPESAPFTPAQRAWLNGFFAGVFGWASAGDTSPAVNGTAHTALPQGRGGDAAHSNGHAAAIAAADGPAAAASVAASAPDAAVPAATAALAPPPAEAPPVAPADEDFPWHDPALPLDERLQLAAGQPLARRLMAAMAQLDCGACGYVCRTYSEAIACGQQRDLTLCAPGGTETARALKRLLQEARAQPPAPPATNGRQQTAPQRSAPPPHVQNRPARAAPSGPEASEPAAAHGATPRRWSRSNPFPARLLSSRRLTHPDAPKDVRHVVLDLLDSGITYEPGDSLGILPVNCPELVDGTLRALGADGEALVPGTDGAPRRLREALAADYTLTRARPALFELLAAHARRGEEAEALRALVQRDDDPFAATADVLQVLEQFPSARPPVEAFLGALARLQPRLYSISSSPCVHPRQVHLTVGVVRFEAAGRWRHGVASHFLGVRCLPGDEVRVFVQPSHRFRLPESPQTPIIMVGPGTGIAPFRAFLQQREATGATGRNWLFFGNQYLDYDFLYRDELESWLDRGVLTRLDVAFSRERAEKVYVQHRMLEAGAQLWQWLQDGAHFYVCGDARRMAADVDAALRHIVAQHGRMTAAQANDYVAGLTRQRRYQRDVY